MDDTPERLNKRVAFLTGTSRREADDMISAGRISVNGQPAVLGARVLATDKVMRDGAPLQGDVAPRYLMLHKPVGYVSSRRRQGDTPTIYELLPRDMTVLKPVGRLDKDSSGLILLSNDGDFAQRMTHPSYRKTKRYEISLDHPLEPLHQQMIADYGVTLPDGASKLTLERMTDDRQRWVVLMSEGRNRQIRRTFSALGYTVTALHRTHFGTYALGSLKPGAYCFVSIS